MEVQLSDEARDLIVKRTAHLQAGNLDARDLLVPVLSRAERAVEKAHVLWQEDETRVPGECWQEFLSLEDILEEVRDLLADLSPEYHRLLRV